MRIYATLPLNRYEAGHVWAVDADGRQLLAPARARGKADNVNAIAHDNALRDPLKPEGDHPYGISRVIAVVPIDMATHQAESYGPFFLKLAAIAGDILRSARLGLGLHGGVLDPTGRLRATHGCLRVDDATIERLAALVRAELARGLEVLYECVEQKTP